MSKSPQQLSKLQGGGPNQRGPPKTPHSVQCSHVTGRKPPDTCRRDRGPGEGEFYGGSSRSYGRAVSQPSKQKLGWHSFAGTWFFPHHIHTYQTPKEQSRAAEQSRRRDDTRIIVCSKHQSIFCEHSPSLACLLLFLPLSLLLISSPLFDLPLGDRISFSYLPQLDTISRST